MDYVADQAEAPDASNIATADVAAADVADAEVANARVADAGVAGADAATNVATNVAGVADGKWGGRRSRSCSRSCSRSLSSRSCSSSRSRSRSRNRASWEKALNASHERVWGAAPSDGNRNWGDSPDRELTPSTLPIRIPCNLNNSRLSVRSAAVVAHLTAGAVADLAWYFDFTPSPVPVQTVRIEAALSVVGNLIQCATCHLHSDHQHLLRMQYRALAKNVKNTLEIKDAYIAKLQEELFKSKGSCPSSRS